MTPEEREHVLAIVRDYDERVARGIVHDPGYVVRMEQYRIVLGPGVAS